MDTSAVTLHASARCHRSIDTHMLTIWMDARDPTVHYKHTRSHSTRETCLTNHKESSFDTNPAASIHRMLKSDALPTQLFSVIDKHNELTSTPSELEDVMVEHFTSVFAIPPPDPHPLPYPPPPMLYHKPNIDPHWYDGLMDPPGPTEHELLELLYQIHH